MQHTHTTIDLVELDARWADGIEVRLMWRRSTDETAIAVFDSRTEEQFTIAVDPGRALDAFRHPFAWQVSGRPLSAAEATR